MAEFKEKSFENETLNVDGNNYENCKFKGCTMIYSGGSDTHVNGCSFDDCKWQFDGAAANTMGFLRAFYHGMGEGGKQMVEATFTSIRQA